MRILVAEDDPDIRDLVQLILEAADFEVITVADGAAALERAIADPPDLFILDVMMPRMTGLELCAALRQLPATADRPIIMLTARAQQADINQGLTGGAADYIVKPFGPRDLLARVTALLGVERGPEPIAEPDQPATEIQMSADRFPPSTNRQR